jgi:septal ring factor EnvC (AmiA/AmiB activator)
LYEVLPHDSHEIFALLGDEQKKAMLPADSLQDYLKDGKPAAQGDPKENVVKGNFVRPLVDYGVILLDERDHRIILGDKIEAIKTDKKLVEAALVEARDQEEACKRDIAAAAADLKKMERERDAVAALDAKLQKSIEAMEAWIARLADTNRAMAGQIAKYQLEAARRIDQRTRAMAQSGGAGKL